MARRRRSSTHAVLPTGFRKADHPMQALHEYELDRLPKTAEIVRLIAKAGRSG